MIHYTNEKIKNVNAKIIITKFYINRKKHYLQLSTYFKFDVKKQHKKWRYRKKKPLKKPIIKHYYTFILFIAKVTLNVFLSLAKGSTITAVLYL